MTKLKFSLLLIVTSSQIYAQTQTKSFRGELGSEKKLFDEYIREQVFNTDSFPVRTVGEISDFCSGTLVGPRHVLTAAHCVYDSADKYWYGDSHFAPGRTKEGKQPFGIYNWEKIYIPAGYLTNRSNSDFAIIHLTEQAGKKLGYLSFSVNQKNDFPIDAAIMGYPGDKNPGTLWQSICPIHYNDRLKGVAHICDTSAGMSGSSIREQSEGFKENIIGIHTWGNSSLNGGVLINQKVFDTLQSFISEKNIPKDVLRKINKKAHEKIKPQDFDQIYIRNNCSLPILVGVAAQSHLDDELIIKGLYNVPRNELTYALLKTKKKKFFVYAETAKAGKVLVSGNHQLNIKGANYKFRKEAIRRPGIGAWIYDVDCR